MKIVMRGLLWMVLLTACAAAMHAQGTTSRFALTPERLAEALVDPKGSDLSFSFLARKVGRSNRVFAGEDGAALPFDETSLRRALTDPPFDVYVLTPYVRAAVPAADARRRYAPVPVLTAAALNADGIIVSIAPSPNFLAADSIENVVLLTDLGRRIVRPARTALETRTVSNALGAHKDVTVGAFYFRFEDFEQLPLAIVCVQASGRTLRLWVEEEDLAK